MSNRPDSRLPVIGVFAGVGAAIILPVVCYTPPPPTYRPLPPPFFCVRAQGTVFIYVTTL